MHKLFDKVEVIFDIEGGTLKFQVDESVPKFARLSVSECARVLAVLSVCPWRGVDKFEDIFIPEDLIFDVLLVSECSDQASVLTDCQFHHVLFNLEKQVVAVETVRADIFSNDNLESTDKLLFA